MKNTCATANPKKLEDLSEFFGEFDEPNKVINS